MHILSIVCIRNSTKRVLEVKESKAEALMALLNDLPYVKTKPLTAYKAKILQDVKESVDKFNQVMAVKYKPETLMNS